MADKQIDLTGMSEKELQQVHNQVLRALATRVRAGGGTVADYDRHSSGHSRSGGGITSLPQEVTAAATAARRAAGTNR